MTKALLYTREFPISCVSMCSQCVLRSSILTWRGCTAPGMQIWAKTCENTFLSVIFSCLAFSSVPNTDLNIIFEVFGMTVYERLFMSHHASVLT